MMDILKTLLRFDDKSKPETVKRPIYLVDTDIRRLVSCMNMNEYKTYASCQGHSFPVDNVPPYIAFRAKVHKAAALEDVLRKDSESANPMLRWGWGVTASFDSEFELCFRLSPSRPHRWHYRFLRSTFIEDFCGLRSMVKLASTVASKGVTLCSEIFYTTPSWTLSQKINHLSVNTLLLCLPYQGTYYYERVGQNHRYCELHAVGIKNAG